MRIAGVDEAGRGPVLGKLVIGCVIYEEEKLPLLESFGVKDSKQLSPNRRSYLAEKIKETCLTYKIHEISVDEINEIPKKGLTLNNLEERYFIQVLNEMDPQPDQIYLDAADVNEERFGDTIKQGLKNQDVTIISKHKADSLFKIVGAASILAKTRRDEIIDSYRLTYGQIGSGYPSDPITIQFLQDYYQTYHNFPPIVRTWWKTALNIENQFQQNKMQKKITDF